MIIEAAAGQNKQRRPKNFHRSTALSRIPIGIWRCCTTVLEWKRSFVLGLGAGMMKMTLSKSCSAISKKVKVNLKLEEFQTHENGGNVIVHSIHASLSQLLCLLMEAGQFAALWFKRSPGPLFPHFCFSG